MTSTRLTRILITTAILVTVIGIVDAALDRNLDIVVVLAIALILQGSVLVRLSTQRPSVTLRADLVRWLEGRSAVTGEPVEQVADRAVATYRAELQTGDESGERAAGQPR